MPALLGGRASPARFLAGFVPAFVIPYVPYLLTGGAVRLAVPERHRAGRAARSLFTVLARAHRPRDRPLAARWRSSSAAPCGSPAASAAARTRREAFAWTLTLLIVCLPVVHAWYWLTPLALGLAAGLWLPLVIGHVRAAARVAAAGRLAPRVAAAGAAGGGESTGLVLSLRGRSPY